MLKRSVDNRPTSFRTDRRTVMLYVTFMVVALTTTAATVAPWGISCSPPDGVGVLEARATTKHLTGGVYRRWQEDNDQRCPKSLTPLLEFSNVVKNLLDPWGEPYFMMCGLDPRNDVFGVVSKGKDRTLGTSDDIASWYVENLGCATRQYD